MDLRRQLTTVRHWLWLVVLSVVVAAGAAYIISSSLPKVYEGRTTLIVGQSLTTLDPNINQILVAQRLSQTYAQVGTTSPILSRVIERLALGMRPEELRRSVSIQALRDSTLLTVTAGHGDAATAADIANALADELIAASPAVEGRQEGIDQFVDQQLAATQRQIENAQSELDELLALGSRTPEQQGQVDLLQGRLTSLRQTYAQMLSLSAGSAANLLSVIDPATPPAEPSSPRVLLNTLLAALLGVIVALGLAFLIEHLDDTVKTPDDIAELAGAPTLGVISVMRLDKKKGDHQRLVTVAAPRSPVAEAFRTLRTNLEFASVDKSLKSLLVTSAVPGEGKSTVSANIALAFAQAGRKVILLDADMRRPSLHRLFEVPNSSGLTTLLRSPEVGIDSVSHSTQEPRLRLITTGPLPPNPAELLGSQRMRDLLARLTGEAAFVVIDSPPLHAVTDAAVLAAEVDGTLLVVQAGRTTRTALLQAREALERVGATVLGVALNRLTERTSARYYYRYDGGDYASARAGATEESEAKALHSTERH